MRTTRMIGDSDGLATLDGDQTQLLDPSDERRLLGELAECKAKLSEALDRIPGFELPEGDHDPQAVSQQIAAFYAGNPRAEARLSAIYRRYHELRGRLAMANVRLVAHIAKRFRDRGVAYSDLLQEGFCGLLEAIDRFDLGHGTKLATYATWWIRQAVQRAVAAGAYPVRLSPRHLRQLAQNQDELDRATPSRTGRGEREESEPHTSTELIHRIHAATRPTVSLDATIDAERSFSLLQTMSDPEGDRTGDVDLDETVGKLMEALRPREQQVLALRFGLGGKPKLSLSQVGQVLEVSKERVRQIQDRAIAKLRDVAAENGLFDALPLGA
jgi:RNA polymerase primary sigma factor